MLVEKCMTFELDEKRYAAWEASSDIPISIFENQTLVTVVSISGAQLITAEWLQKQVGYWLEADDVFTLHFLAGILFEVDKNLEQVTRPLSSDILRLLEKWKTSSHGFIERQSKDVTSRQGVYIVDSGYLREVLRLHEDTHNAYTLSMRRNPEGRLIPLGLGGSPFNRGCIAVHSRTRQNVQSRFHGISTRVAIKDQFGIQGFKTTVGSHAWRRLYPAATNTAPAVQRLIDQGFEITGFTQMCSLHQYQQPTQCIDFQAPWNARADGYQSPSGGSSGQGAAIGAYDWLDFAIGSDTTVSARMPAQSNGCFALRTTWGAVSNEGTWNSNPWFDVSALFGRNISKFPSFIDAWYGEKLLQKEKQKKITKIYCLEESLSIPNNQQIAILRTCVQELEACLEAEVQWISLKKLWADDAPEIAGKQSLDDFLGEEVKSGTWVYADWNLAFQPFQKEYMERFGEEPYWPPPHGISRWDAAIGLTEAHHEEALRNIDVYRKWLRNMVFNAEDQLVIMPIRNVQPDYRDTWENPRGGSEKLWEPQMLSPILGMPELVVPVGEIPFTSRITKNEEYLPVCVSIMGAHGSDIQLAETVEKWLIHARRPTKVLTGKRMFG